MGQDGWPWVIAGLVTTVALPVLVNWSHRHPPHSARRLVGWALVLSASVVTADGILALNTIGRRWLVVVLVAGQAAAAVPLGIGWARLREDRRRAESPGPDRLALVLGDPALWVRPRPRDGDPPRGFGGRVDRWLASDGPVPTAGWWHNGGLILDERGPALVDAAGLRHDLPAGTRVLVRIATPRSVLLVDGRQTLLARLPTTGFGEDDLRRFALAAGWRYDRTARPTRTAREAVDLRTAVVDQAAKDRRPTRTGRVLRRPDR